MMHDAICLRALTPCASEAPVCTRNALYWRIAIADDHSFYGCFVKGGAWRCIDPIAVPNGCAHQHARLLPHQRRLAWKCLTPDSESPPPWSAGSHREESRMRRHPMR